MQLNEEFEKKSYKLACFLKHAVRSEVHESMIEILPLLRREIRAITTRVIYETVPGIVRTVVNETVPDIVDNVVNETVPGIVRNVVNETVPGIVNNVVNETVPGIVRNVVNETVPGIVRTMLIEVLYSPQFAEYLRSLFPGTGDFGEIARPFLNRDVTVTTTGGTVIGVLTEIGTDFVRIQESGNSQVLIPFYSAISISAS